MNIDDRFFENLKFSQKIIIFDLINNKETTVYDLTEIQKKLPLKKVQKNHLDVVLSDDICSFGLIILTNKFNKLIGHIIVYYVDDKNNLFFIDCQREESKRVFNYDENYFKNFHNNVFFYKF